MDKRGGQGENRVEFPFILRRLLDNKLVQRVCTMGRRKKRLHVSGLMFAAQGTRTEDE